MAAYALNRLIWTIPVLLAVSLVTFVLMHSVEGGPWDAGDRKLPPEVEQNLDRKYGLDQPLWQQYGRFVWNALQGDLGLSFQGQDRPVTEVILTRLRTSATLGALALVSALGAGIMLGVAAAAHRGSAIDHASVLAATAGAAVPGFVVAVFLMYFFGVKLDLLPVLGWGRPAQAVLPVVTLSLAPAATLARLTRASMIEALADDYVRTATAKGLRRSVVLYRHALRNAAFPLLSALGPITAGLITGSFIVEQVFSIPGLGRAFVTSVNARDYGMIMGTTLFAAALIAVVNLAVDISYGVLDPRVRHRAYAR